MHRRKGKSKILKLLIVLSGLCITMLGVYLVMHKHTVKNVYVEGNLHYTKEEIQDMVMTGPLGNNSLYLSLKYRLKKTENIPFIDVLDVNILTPDTIKITVYEKALAGYIRYMDAYMYFDRDGYVVECSKVKTEGIPQITGLSFDHMILGEILPVENQDAFESIMELTKLLDKYDLEADKIFFHSAGDMTIYFGDIKAALGSDRNQLEIKMMRLPQLLAKLEGKKGTLRMENLTQDRTDVSFQVEH